MRLDLPTQAVNLDGSFIEEMIPGYMTVETSGREALTSELETITIGRADGETFRASRYPARKIEVEFLLRGTSNPDIRRKLNDLNNLLTADTRDVIFNDEDDKYFTGIPSLESVEFINRTAVKGKYQIYCPWPFKRSVEVKEAVAVVGEGTTATFNIDYNGTYPAKPVLVAEFIGASEDDTYSGDGDCGYVLFVDGDENIIQLGNPDAIDLDSFTKAGQLINKIFTSLTGWSQSGGHTWGDKVIDGSMSKALIKDAYWNKGKGQSLYHAKPTYGSNTTKWHGPILRQTLTTSEVNFFDVAIVHRMCCNATNQIGTFECGTYASDGTMVAGFVIEKTTSGTDGTVKYIVGGKTVGTDAIDLSYNNTHFGYCQRKSVYKKQYYSKSKKKWSDKKIKGAKTRSVVKSYTYTQSNLNSTIQKAADTFTFKVGNLATRKFVNSDLEISAISEVSMHFGCYKGKPRLHTNAVRSFKLTANPGTFTDTPNVFTAGDIIEADCYDASVTLRRADTEDGQLAPQFGALGNNWEGFELKPGTNVIGAAWSPWLSNPLYYPKLKILYNEVFI